MDRFAIPTGGAPGAGAMIGLGCAVMVVAALVSLAGTGAGHGWMVPLGVTIFLFPLWPIAAWLPARTRVRPWLELGLAAMLTAFAAVPAYQLLVDEFRTWDRGRSLEVAPPWFGIAVIAAGTLAALAWLWRERKPAALLPTWVLGLGLLVDIGILWQAAYGPGPWGYRAAEPDVMWFFLWGAWHVPAAWALLRAFDPLPDPAEDFE